MSRLKSFRLAACAALWFVGSPLAANALPITLDFVGVIKGYSDFTSSNSYGVGTTFSGYVTYDVDNAEGTSFQESNPGNFSSFASSQSGCVQYVNGECISNRGAGTPVVTDYLFNWVGGTVTPWEYSLTFQDGSSRVNLFDVPPAPITGEGWQVERNQFQIDVNGDIANHITQTTVGQRLFGLQAYSNDDAFLTGAIDDFAQGFDTELLFSGGRISVDVIDYVSVEDCVGRDNCTTIYSPDSYRLRGEFTSARFSVAPIPEPSTLLLFGTGMVVMILYVWRRERLQPS